MPSLRAFASGAQRGATNRGLIDYGQPLRRHCARRCSSARLSALTNCARSRKRGGALRREAHAGGFAAEPTFARPSQRGREFDSGGMHDSLKSACVPPGLPVSDAVRFLKPLAVWRVGDRKHLYSDRVDGDYRQYCRRVKNVFSNAISKYHTNKWIRDLFFPARAFQLGQAACDRRIRKPVDFGKIVTRIIV